MAAGERVRVRVLISGRVQGVFYRASTADQARALGLTGWVRNLPDGRVEAVFQGPAEAVEEAVAWCRHGPPAARVQEVEITDEAPTDDRRFEVRP